MTETIHFNGFDVPIISYAVRANAILGIRGAGKTYTATYIAENLMDYGIPLVVIDPLGIWRHLKTPNGENGKGYQIVTVGSEGDIRIGDDFEPENVVDIIESAIQKNISLIFDTSRPRVNKETMGQILTLAFGTLFLKNEGIRHIFVEEAAQFMPQSRKTNRDLYEILEQINREGGNYQLGITAINQRAEQLNKEILELCDTVFLHRQRGNNSLKTMKKWIGMGVVDDASEVLSSMATLKAGECWILEQDSPTPHRVTVPQKNSLHPDRARFTEGYLNRSLDIDIQDFVNDINSGMKDKMPVYSWTPPSPLPEPEPVATLEINTNIDWNQINDGLKQSDYKIYREAQVVRFGGIPVKDMIDNLIKKGYTYRPTSFGFGQLVGNDNIHPFNLSDRLQSDYAQMILRRINP